MRPSPGKLRLRLAFSAWRAIVLAVILTAMFSVSVSAQIFFSPYKDVTNSANWNTGEQQTAVTGTVEPVTSAMPNSTLSWAFATGVCGSENWAGISPALEASNVQNFVNAGKYYVVSTGGANGTFDCPSNAGMQTFINTYYSANMAGVDYDIEGGQSQGVIDDLINSTKYAEGMYPNMRFSFTVATLGAVTTGSDLNSLGDLVMTEIGRLGLGGNYYVDLMAFDYGSAIPSNCVVSGSNCDMAQSAIAAAESLHAHFGTPYSHIELCLMIGQADAGPSETLSLSDVDTIVSWGKSVGLGGFHFWSFDRDQPSGSSSASGDGTSNPPLSYTNRFDSDLGASTTPSFNLSDSPGSLTVMQGGSGTSTITVTSNAGFDSAVAVSVSGLPSGVTASLSSVSVTPPANGSATATLTLTASNSATGGTATVTITGISGGLTRTTSVSLIVASPNGCDPAWSPTQVYTGGGTASVNGENYQAAYWTQGANPATNNGPPGSGQPWIPEGVCGSLQPSFTMAASPSSLSVKQGASGTSTITVTPANGFTGSVTLTASGLPSGVTASFGANPTTGTSVLMLAASSSATAGSSTVTITGTSGSLKASTMVALTVTSNSPSFTLSASPSSLSVKQGASGTSTITVTPANGFTGSITLAASVLPSGVTASFGANPTTGTSVLMLAAGSSATAGSSTVTITGTSGSASATTTIALTVTSSGSGSGSLTLSPASYNFGSAAVGTGTAWVTFTLTNGGSTAASIGSVSVSGPFVAFSNCGASVAAGSSCPIYVYFAPTAAGSSTGTLTVSDNAGNSPQTAALSGTGT